ncbi:hypothetical protein [Flavobacterium hungaricum]|uniref:TonB C-terminal domain-containing protein n=1 Tax=Flavobacterium hungaricum TaxID=2082725 RepID=A0ABR9TRF1_9FLAO|nr:hypothetical protein [Flavobacterium hungaricum]MBE8727639.1 hypothetical protein [Flavobacterium hungaricum]
MKSQNKKTVIIAIYFLSLLSSYAQNDINKLFLNLPLEASRDTIYSAIKKYGFIEKKSNGIVTRDDEIVKTFFGYLDPKTSKNTVADSIYVELTTGSVSTLNEKHYHDLLTLRCHYHFSNPRAAKIFYRDQNIEIEKINSQKLLRYQNYIDNLKPGTIANFNDAEDGKNVSIAFTRKKPGYIVVTLEYQRYEGEKKIFRQFRPKKELVFREIEPKNLFNYNNVEQVPVTKKCSNKNDKSKKCFIESIWKHISYDVYFEDYNLTPGDHRIGLNFIITKNNEIVNIKVSHKNQKLCEDVAQSISEIKILEPAVNNGIKVDFLFNFPLTFHWSVKL